jgi:hypothetical protein
MSLFKEAASEVEGLEKALLKTINADGSLRDNKVSAAIECLALTRDEVRQIDAQYKELTAPIELQLAPFAKERKQLKAALERIEMATRDALLAELKETGALPEESANGVRLSIVIKPKVFITDAKKIPDRFLLPREQCIDKEALLAHLKKEREAFKAMAQLNPKAVPKTTAPGAALSDDVILSTRLPEVIA